LPPRLSLSRARLLDAQGNPAAARSRVEAALQQDPGRCDARVLLYQLTRREGSMADQGAALFQQFGCASCHRSDAQGQCPRLDGIYGKEQLMEGGEKVIADDSYIRESVLSPLAKVVAGFKPIMPSFQGQVSEEQLQQLIAYIKSIGPPEANNATPGAAKGSTKISGEGSNPVSKPPIMTTGSPNVGAPQNEHAMPEVLPPANPAAPNQPGQTR